MRIAFIGVLLALAVPASAAAGGWMTVGLAPPPDDIRAGDTWTAQMTVLQHGRTPWQGGPVSVTVTAGGDRRTFEATGTGEPGVYRAEVLVPRGDWRYTVIDPFGASHGFPPVESAAPAAAAAATSGGDPDPWVALVAVLAAVALLGGFAAFALRRSLTPA